MIAVKSFLYLMVHGLDQKYNDIWKKIESKWKIPVEIYEKSMFLHSHFAWETEEVPKYFF